MKTQNEDTWHWRRIESSPEYRKRLGGWDDVPSMIKHYLNIFFLLIGFHFVCDYALQSDAMAKGKSDFKNALHGVPWYYWLIAHFAIHAVAVGIITQSAILGLIEFVGHGLLDFRKSAGLATIH